MLQQKNTHKKEDKGALNQSSQLQPEKLSAELKAYADYLDRTSNIIKEKLSGPLTKMIKDANGNLSQDQQNAFEKFYNRGNEIFTNLAIDTGKEILNFPKDIDNYSLDDKLAFLRVELAKNGLFLDADPKTIIVDLNDKQIAYGVFNPKIYPLSEPIKGEEAYKLKNNQKLQLPPIEGRMVDIPQNTDITRRMLMGMNLKDVSVSGCVISHINDNDNTSVHQIVINPHSIEVRAKEYGMSIDEMYNHTLINEVSSIALTEHLGKELVSKLHHQEYPITLKMGPNAPDTPSPEIQLNIRLAHIGELYSDIASLSVNGNHVRPILDHFDKRDQYSLITASIFSAILKADKDGLIIAPEGNLTAENISNLFSADRDVEIKFVEKYLLPEMQKIFNIALDECKK